MCVAWCVFFQAEDGMRGAQESRGLGGVYMRQAHAAGSGLSPFLANLSSLNCLAMALSNDAMRALLASVDFSNSVTLCTVVLKTGMPDLGRTCPLYPSHAADEQRALDSSVFLHLQHIHLT